MFVFFSLPSFKDVDIIITTHKDLNFLKLNFKGLDIVVGKGS